MARAGLGKIIDSATDRRIRQTGAFSPAWLCAFVAAVWALVPCARLFAADVEAFRVRGSSASGEARDLPELIGESSRLSGEINAAKDAVRRTAALAEKERLLGSCLTLQKQRISIGERILQEFSGEIENAKRAQHGTPVAPRPSSDRVGRVLQDHGRLLEEADDLIKNADSEGAKRFGELVRKVIERNQRALVHMTTEFHSRFDLKQLRKSLAATDVIKFLESQSILYRADLCYAKIDYAITRDALATVSSYSQLRKLVQSQDIRDLENILKRVGYSPITLANWMQDLVGVSEHVRKERKGTPPGSAAEVTAVPDSGKLAKTQVDREARDEQTTGYVVVEVDSKLPVMGRDWLLPDLNLNMGFVWIAELECWVGKHEVTNAQLRVHDRSQEYAEGHSDHPASVSYLTATSFAKWLTEECRDRGKVPDGFEYRLPTGREWLTFAQCGDGRTYPWGNDALPSQGNYALNLAGDRYIQTCPVSKAGENSWRLFGVGGNVWEWTTEQFSPGVSGYNVLRGASWTDTDRQMMTCAAFILMAPSVKQDTFGFRLVLARPGERGVEDE